MNETSNVPGLSQLFILIGGGGHSNVVLEVAQLQGLNCKGYVAQSESQAMSKPYLGSDEIFVQQNQSVNTLAMGIGSVQSSSLRENVFQVFKNAGFRFATLIHPKAIVSPGATIGEGTVVMAGSIIQPGARIGANCIINTGAIIDHDCVIADHVHVAPGVTLSGSVKIGPRSHIGTGSSVVQGLSIGSDVTIGAGSVLLNDVSDGSRAWGVPARRKN